MLSQNMAIHGNSNLRQLGWASTAAQHFEGSPPTQQSKNQQELSWIWRAQHASGWPSKVTSVDEVNESKSCVLIFCLDTYFFSVNVSHASWMGHDQSLHWLLGWGVYSHHQRNEMHASFLQVESSWWIDCASLHTGISTTLQVVCMHIHTSRLPPTIILVDHLHTSGTHWWLKIVVLLIGQLNILIAWVFNFFHFQ